MANTVRKNMIFWVSMIGLSVVGLSGMARADIWQECDYLVTSARDKNADGVINSSELINQMRGETGVGTNDKVGSGRLVYTNLNVATYSAYADARPEYAGWTATNRVCIYADQTAAHCSLKTGYNPGVSNYTFICRVRRDETNTADYSYLITASLEKLPGKTGVVFYLGPGSKQDPINENGQYVGNKIHLRVGHGDFNVSSRLPFRNRHWVNLAVVVSNMFVKVGVKDDTMSDIAWETMDFSGNSYVRDYAASLMPSGNIYFFGTPYADPTSFHGAMQFAAAWKRPLSQDEIVEAFSDRHPAVWCVGVEGRGADIFGGEPGQGETVLPLSLTDWSRLPKAFSTGDSVRIPFDIQYEEDGLSQYVRLKGRSGTGVFRVSVDGVAYGEETVLPGGVVRFFIPGETLTRTRTHVCTVARVDQGASDVSIDFYDMMGSFRVGLDDNSTEGTGRNGAENVVDYLLNNANLRAFKAQLVPRSTNTTGGAAITGLDRCAYLVDIPADVANHSRFVYTAKWYDPNAVVGQRLLLKVNDSKTYETVVTAGARTFTYKFRPGDLLPGRNRFEWSFPDVVPRYKPDGKTKIDYYYRCDYQKLEAKPSFGLVLVVR